MRKRNRFHFVMDVNRRFLASGTVISNDHGTDVSINVDPDPLARDAATCIMLLAAHNITRNDDHREIIQNLLAAAGFGKSSPIKSKEVTPAEVLGELEDDIPF